MVRIPDHLRVTILLITIAADSYRVPLFTRHTAKLLGHIISLNPQNYHSQMRKLRLRSSPSQGLPTREYFEKWLLRTCRGFIEGLWKVLYVFDHTFIFLRKSFVTFIRFSKGLFTLWGGPYLWPMQSSSVSASKEVSQEDIASPWLSPSSAPHGEWSTDTDPNCRKAQLAGHCLLGILDWPEIHI